MFITKDAVPVKLCDEVFVVYIRQKKNKNGKYYFSQNPRDVVIYKMRVFGIHNILTFDRESNKVEAVYADGVAWNVDDLPEAGAPDHTIPSCSAVRANTNNTFATLEAAEAGLRVYQLRGLCYFGNAVFYGDERMSERVIF